MVAGCAVMGYHRYCRACDSVRFAIIPPSKSRLPRHAMTDSQLIELVEGKDSKDLSLDELFELACRLRESDQLRTALADRLETDLYLGDALERIRLLADRITTQSQHGGSRAQVYTLVAALAAVLLVATIATLLVLRWQTPEPRPEVAQAAQKPRKPVDAVQPVEPKPEPAPSKPPPVSVPAKPDVAPVAVKPVEAAPEKPVKAAPEEPIEAASNKPEEVAPAKPAAESRDELTAAEAQDLFAVAPIGGSGMALAELKNWFTAVPGQPDPLKARETPPDPSVKTPLVDVKGLAHLNWNGDQPLRLCLRESQMFKVQMWNGSEGVLIQYYGGTGLVAYRTTRTGKEPAAETLALLANDEWRMWRATPPSADERGPFHSQPILDLRHDNGQLIVNCGDVKLLSVPMARKPGEVYFDGHAVFQYIGPVTAMPAAVFRKESLAWTVERDIAKPADLNWLSDRPSGAEFLKLEDGAVELVSENATRLTWAATRIPRNGVCEVLLELDGFTPGTGVYLGDERGEPRYVLGCYRQKGAQHTIAHAVPIPSPPNPPNPQSPPLEEIAIDPNGQPPQYVNKRLWVRMLVTGGMLKYWLSADGVTWARAWWPGHFTPAGFQTVGLYSIPGNDRRALKLCRVTLRQLPTLTALADVELLNKSPAVPPYATYAEWLQAVYGTKPDNVEPAAWTRTCAVRSLASGTVGAATPAILDMLIKEQMRRNAPWPQTLRLLDEAMMMYPPPVDATQPERLFRPYYELARRMSAMGEQRPYTRIVRAATTAPVWMFSPVRPAPDPLIRAEALNLAYTGQWESLYCMCRQVKFSRRQTIGSWQDIWQWGEAVAAETLVKKLRGSPELGVAWRNPVVIDLNRDDGSNLNDLTAALERQAYGEACRIITKAGSHRGRRGLMPTPGDSRLLTSWSVALEALMREHAPWRTEMRQSMAAEARLRVREAIDLGDSGEIETAAMHYFGTEAAAEAYIWLGDQAMLAADAARAAAYYRLAGDMCDESGRQRVEAGMQLASAMLGRGGAAKRDLEFGETRLSVGEIDALRQQRASVGVDNRPVALESPQAPAPKSSRYDAAAWSKYEGQTWTFEYVPPPVLPMDWLAQQVSFQVDGKRLLLASGFQVASYDLSTGALQWKTSLPPEQQRRFTWEAYRLTAAVNCPVVAPGRIYAWRLTTGYLNGPTIAPSLACLDSTSGNVLWATPPDPVNLVVSNPLLVQDQLLALMASIQEPAAGAAGVAASGIGGETTNREWGLMLGVFDPQTGKLLHKYFLASLLDTWQSAATFQMTALEDSLIASCMGTALCFDLTGELRWARHELTLPPSLDGNWQAQWRVPPLVAGELCYVAQPGVHAVLCMESKTGRLRWRAQVPDLHKLVGLVDGRVIVHRDDGFQSIDAATGKVQWCHEANGVLSVLLCGEPGGLLYARSEKAAENLYRPALVWVDLGSGIQRGISPLDSLRHAQLRLGPTVAVDNRLLALFGSDPNPDAKPSRDIVALTPQGTAISPPQDTDWDLWTANVSPELRRAATQVLPDWMLFESPSDPQTGYAAENGGEKNVLTTICPTQLAKRITVPVGGKPRLRIRAASVEAANWWLIVDANGKQIVQQPVNATAPAGTWKDFDVDLAPLAGQTIWVAVRALPNGGAPHVRWSRIEVLN